VPGVGAVVVAAGRGDRFGAAKQFLPLDGARLVDRAVAACAAVADAVVVVLPSGITWDGSPVATPVVGGTTRSASVRAGLDAVVARDPATEIVIVHDAARPLADRALFDAVVAAVRAGADAAVPAVPVADTIKRVEGDRVVATLERAGLVAVQTPQAFRTAALRSAHAAGGEATDDAALVEAHGGVVVWVPGSPRNFKITDLADFDRAAALLVPEPR
jgi:2-C-methyl-D-erythritol 4-phosphate cytidylyltransferase